MVLAFFRQCNYKLGNWLVIVRVAINSDNINATTPRSWFRCCDCQKLKLFCLCRRDFDGKYTIMMLSECDIDYSNPFYILLIEFHCKFSISYKILPYYVYCYCIVFWLGSVRLSGLSYACFTGISQLTLKLFVTIFNWHIAKTQLAW